MGAAPGPAPILSACETHANGGGDPTRLAAWGAAPVGRTRGAARGLRIAAERCGALRIPATGALAPVRVPNDDTSSMLSFSTNPEVAEQQMNAIIFYLTAFGYIDGEFDFTEKTFIKIYIRQLITARARLAMPDADPKTREDVINRFVTHFHEVFEGIDRSIKDLFDEAVADGEPVEQFVYGKLKLRSY